MGLVFRPVMKKVFGDVFPFDPKRLFASGQQGSWYEPYSLRTLFQDSAGTTPVSATGQPVGLMLDVSGNDKHASQAITAARPTYEAAPERLTFDGVDDNMSADFTGSGGFSATLLQGTEQGIIHAKVNVPDGAYSFYTNPIYEAAGNVTGQVLREGVLTDSEVKKTKAYLQANGAGNNFRNVTSMVNWFRDRTDLVEVYANDWYISNVSNLTSCFWGCSNLVKLNVANWDVGKVIAPGSFVRDCSSLISLDVSNWDTSSVTSFLEFARGCSSLTSLDVSNWNTSKVISFQNFVLNCSSLGSLDLSNWNTSKVGTFRAFAANCSSLTTVTVNGGVGNPFADSPCTDYQFAFNGTNLTQQSIDDILVAIEAAGTSTGIFDQSGGSAPSAAGEAAIDGLRARGWTVTVTGGY